MEFRFLRSINDVDAASWNSLAGVTYPFCRHEFLLAMEQSGSATTENGWQPQHLLLMDGESLLAAMPLYLKYHSYGEYVFDWSWAGAYERNGKEYYPKLLSAIPYTPATGPRLLTAPGVDIDAVCAQLGTLLQQLCKQNELSSAHILLSSKTQTEQLQGQILKARASVQYHWFNDGYDSFDDFLSSFTSRKRKSLRKERQRVAEQDITLKRVQGKDITAEMWEDFYLFYQMTYSKRSGHGGYLNKAFFEQLSAEMPEQVMLVLAQHAQRNVAGALFFIGGSTLYGRYWGCREEFEMLHFEACYYQGIDFCIEQGLEHFDPGAQGEHKIQRGFIPVNTHSLHYIENTDFREAIERFLLEEHAHLKQYREEACEALPFNSDYLDRSPLSSIIDSGDF